jgi:hypothetical protein
MEKVTEGGKIITYKNREYYISETDNHVTLKSVKKSKRGLHSVLKYTKDDETHSKSLNYIKEFFLREII